MPDFKQALTQKRWPKVLQVFCNGLCAEFHGLFHQDYYLQKLCILQEKQLQSGLACIFS